MPTKAIATPVETLTPSNQSSVLDFAILTIAITPTTIDANASPKVTMMSIAMRQHDIVSRNPDASENSPLLEIALVLVRLNHVASFIVNANHSIM
jgi:hypothetical protein